MAGTCDLVYWDGQVARTRGLGAEGTQGFACQCPGGESMGLGAPGRLSRRLYLLCPLCRGPAAWMPSSGLQPGPLSGSHARSSACSGAPAWALLWASPSGMAPGTPGRPQAQSPAPAGGPWAGVPPGAQPQPLPGQRVASAGPQDSAPVDPSSPHSCGWGDRPYFCLFQLDPAPQSPAPAQPARAPASSTSLTSGAGSWGAPAPRRPPGPAVANLGRLWTVDPQTCVAPGRPAGSVLEPGRAPAA